MIARDGSPLPPQFVSRVLDAIEGSSTPTSTLVSPVGFHDFALPADAAVRVDALAAVTRVILADAIAAGTAEASFRAKLARAGIPEEAIAALATGLFGRLAGGELQRRRTARLPALLAGRTLLSFDWTVQQTLASSNLDRPVAPSVVLSLRTAPSGGAGEAREDFLELSAEELDAAIAQLQGALVAGAAVAGAAVQQRVG